MAYVITDTCIKDSLCVEVCPTDCIHPKTDEPGFEGTWGNYPFFKSGVVAVSSMTEGLFILKKHPSAPVP